jgi:hypothetical protein
MWTRRLRKPAASIPWLAGVLAGVLAVPPCAHAQGTETAGARAIWWGPDGTPLPFESDDEVLEFLKDADVEGSEPIGRGINRSRKLTLERGGIRAHAAFRDVEIERSNVRIEGRYYFRFFDSYRHECAAYALARLLGLDNVPPAVVRRVSGRHGSVQIWVERTLEESADGFSPPDIAAWTGQVWDKVLLDNLIYNVDRNSGNILTSPEYRLWLIDHTRAFQVQEELLDPDRLQRVNRRAWRRLDSTTDEELRSAVREYLAPAQMAALVKRRDLLLAHVQRLVDERGEDVVFY